MFDVYSFYILASLVGGILKATVYKTGSWLAYGFAWLGSQILILESKLLAWVIDLSTFTTMPVVQDGWRIVRDLANLFFIAILIYIAFATILRLRGFSATQMLGKVLIIAILINFSLMIGGVIIDFSQVLMRYFLFAYLPDNTPHNGYSFSKQLASAMMFQKFWAPDQEISGVYLESLGDLLVVFSKLLFVMIFIFISAIVLGALVLLLLVRVFWLWFLLIFAPIAWVLSVVPLAVLSNYARQWWQKFLQYAFLGPIIAFFIYLAFSVVMYQENNRLTNIFATSSFSTATIGGGGGLGGGGGGAGGGSNGTGFDDFGEAGFFTTSAPTTSIFNIFTVMQLGLILGFLIAGLMAGSALSPKIAGGALKFLKIRGESIKQSLQQKAKETSWKTLDRTGVTKLGLRLEEGLGALAEKGKGGRFAATTLRVAGLAKLAELMQESKEKLKATTEERQKKYKREESSHLEKVLPSLTGFDRVAALKELADRDKLKDKYRDEIIKLFPRFGFEGTLNEIFKKRPYWSPEARELANKVITAATDQEKEQAQAQLVVFLGEKLKKTPTKDIAFPEEKPGDKFQETFSNAIATVLVQNRPPKDLFEKVKNYPLSEKKKYFSLLFRNAPGKNLEEKVEFLKSQGWQKLYNSAPGFQIIFGGDFKEAVRSTFSLEEKEEKLEEKIRTPEEKLEEEIQETQRNLQASQEEINRLTTELRILQQRLARTEAMEAEVPDKTSSRAQELRGRIESLRAEVESLKTKLIEKNEGFDNWRRILEEKRRELAKLKKKDESGSSLKEKI